MVLFIYTYTIASGLSQVPTSINTVNAHTKRLEAKLGAPERTRRWY
ncbi:hypothetical protein HNQ92_001726 [Rhabdobacter roseus]|uniref:Uncharacterized protein n=1 Tax=Rhabdobacter roseus TaxID=1655419 RepID=A0A840TUD2_9BACT|nr:hypothetical protein [Rhabdobacter roseus]